MKKFSVVMMSILTIILGSLLTACTFKKAEVNFLQSEVVISSQEQKEIDLNDFLQVKNIDKSKISYRLSNPALFDLDNSKITAKENAYGRSFVYATYQNNSLSSMQLIVRKKFAAPTNITMDEEANLIWDVTSGIFEDEEVPTLAQSYRIVGTYVTYLENGGQVSENIDKSVVGNTVKLSSLLDRDGQGDKNGKYTLQIQAEKIGYFDNGFFSSEQTFYVGYMPKLTKTDFVWNDGLLSWSGIQNAEFQVKLDGELLPVQTSCLVDLTQALSLSQETFHTVSVLVYDTNTGEDRKLTNESEVVAIEKLAIPHASLGNGQVVFNEVTNAEKFKVILTSSDGKKTEILSNSATSLIGLASGVYDAEVVAINTSTENFYFHSDSQSLGKIFKLPSIDLTYTGNNTPNGDVLNATFKLSNLDLSMLPVDTVVKVYLDGLVSTLDGLATDESSENLSISISEAGKHTLSLALSANSQNYVVGGQMIYVLDSDATENVTVTKLDPFVGNVTHNYENGVSVLSFAKVANAKTYQLKLYDGSNFQAVSEQLFEVDSSNGKITFVDQIENLFTPTNGRYRFQVIAATEDDTLAINSLTLKEIEVLPAPQSEGSGNSTSKTYTWGLVPNADEYRLEIFTLNKTEFEQLKNSASVSFESEGETAVTNRTSYEFDEVGYYLVKVYAISNHEDSVISSADCLQEAFFIATQLELGQVNFGYDENNPNPEGLTNASGYFVEVSSTSNVVSYEFSLNGVAETFDASNELTTHLLRENFESSAHKLVLIGHGIDDTLYIPTAAYELSVEKLAKVTESDLNTYLLIDDFLPTPTVTVKAKTGVRNIWMAESGGNYVSKSDNATLQIGEKSNFEISVLLYGSLFDETTHIFNVTNGKVYLDSDLSVLSFQRLNAPTSLQYYDGNLNFLHTNDNINTQFYVVDMLCNTADNQQFELSVRFAQKVTAVYGTTSVDLGSQSDFVSTSGTLNNNISIKLDKVIELLKNNATLSPIYAQAKEIKFAVYAYQTNFVGGSFVLSSAYATSAADGTTTFITLEKMSSPIVTISKVDNQYVLSWNAVNDDSTFASETLYEIYKVGETEAFATTTSTSCTLEEKDFNSSIFVRATNPYYLESADSNFVKVQKLGRLKTISLTENGTLSFQVSAEDVDRCNEVLLSINGAASTSITLTQGKATIAIGGEGEYSFQLKGSITTLKDGTVECYVDSDISSWTVTNLSKVAPESLQVNIQNNNMTWSGLKVESSALEYVVIFKDEDGKIVKYKTADTSVNWLTNQTLRTSLERSLKEGQITIGLSAHINPTIVALGGTVYFAEETTLLDGTKEFNHLIYTNTKQIKKLSQPEVAQVEFENVEAAPYTQTPNINVTITGNYGQTATFQIYREGIDEPIGTIEVDAKNGTYTFTLLPKDFNIYVSAGQTLTFKVYAISRGDNSDAIASSAGEVVITRANDLAEVGFVEDNLGLTKTFKVGYNHASETLGGIVLKATFTSSTATNVEYVRVETTGQIEEGEGGFVTYDFSSLISKFLSKGGTISVEAFVQSVSTNGKHILASSIKADDPRTVLQSVERITAQDFGFVITNSNNEDTIYVVCYDGQSFEVSKEDDFAFTIPNNWENGTYNLSIYATAKNSVASAENPFAFQLSRIAAVENVSLARGDNNLSTLSWTAVSEANGYVLNVYKRDGNTKGTLLTTADTTATNFSLEDLFGTNHENLIGENKFTLQQLQSDASLEVWLEVVAKGGSNKNNSFAKVVYAKIKGNPSTLSSLVVDEHGILTFAMQDEQYLYRFVSGEGASLSNWTQMTSNKLDTSALSMNGLPFNVEIKVKGSDTANSTDEEFVFDSITFTTLQLSQTYYKMETPLKVEIDASATGGLKITLPTNDFTSVYVGFSENAIWTGDVKAVTVYPLGLGDDNDENVYSVELAELLEILGSANLNESSVRIFFWVYKQAQSEIGYVISDPCDMSFNLQANPGFVDIYKGKYQIASGTTIEDYANTFAVFTKSTLPITVGMVVKIDWLDGNYSYTTFVTTSQMQEHSSRFNGYAINLTDIFEKGKLKNLSGRFSVNFARVSVSLSMTVTLSNWLAQPLAFEKLSDVSAVELNQGNLSWSASDEKTTNYYVYFYSDIEEDSYSFVSTTFTSFNASDFAGKDSTYYLAVQAINENDKYVLSSSKLFNLDETGENQLIYKNQINSPLLLRDGNLVIDWTLGDFYNTLMEETNSFPTLAKKLVSTTFTSPFTFTIKDLVENNGNNLNVRLRFTQVIDGVAGAIKTYDIKAIDLLANLIEFGKEQGDDILARFTALANQAESIADSNLINTLREMIENGTYGVANKNSIFDKNFETLQVGSYRLEYCLITASSTLNSQWYGFKNDKGSDIIYVSEEPSVDVNIVRKNVNDEIVLDEKDSFKNEFRVIFKKSQIYQYSAGYTLVSAQTYVMKLGEQTYSIYKADSTYKLCMLGEESQTISVYECDLNGNLRADGDYLMFFLNYNNGDSFLGAFETELRGAQDLQIYAVGNSYAISSKSSFFSVTFLSFGDFNINDGVFSWTTYQNRDTSVFVTKSTSKATTKIPVAGSGTSASYSLEGWGNGTYNLKFVIQGEKNGNIILVDSEVYVANNVYKLDSPTLNNDRGYISIGLVDETMNQLQNSYSDNELHQYLIYNNISGASLSKTFSDSTGSATYFYEAGVTNLDKTDPDYLYKSTEQQASNFQVRIVGTTATLSFDKDEKDYYIKNIRCVDLNGSLSSKGIALRSEFNQLPALMLDDVTNIHVEEGVVKWNAVTGRGNLQPENNASVVYKVIISKYIKSTTTNGVADTNVIEDLIYYTANTYFDMAILQETETDALGTYLKVTVQALALLIASDNVFVDKVSLVEGGFGYGNVTYANSQDLVLMGGCSEPLKDIVRLDPVDEVFVENGSLSWKFTTSYTLTENNFRDYYDFVVTDDEGKEIKGTYTLMAEGNTFYVAFTEEDGQMKSGTYSVNVYVTQGQRNQDLTIKSFARSLVITKTAKLEAKDFVVDSNLDNNTETLSLQEYFSKPENINNVVTATVQINGTVQRFIFTVERFKLYVLRQELAAGQNLDYSDGYALDANGRGYIVIGGNTAKISYIVINGDNVDSLFSDTSEEFSLHRTEWGDFKISWDSLSQQFTWNYDLHSFNTTVTAQKLRIAYVLTSGTTLYKNPQLQAEAGENPITLESGTEVEVTNASGSASVEIVYNGTTYYIAKGNVASVYKNIVYGDGENVTEVLQPSDLFTIVEKGDEDSVITIGGQLYQVKTSNIVDPVFIVEATYNNGNYAATRIYTTTENVFRPTIIGQVSIKVRIKVNNINLLSEECESSTENFNLFASGDGTSANPYVISTSEQFKNIAYRMTKDDMLKKYSIDTIEYVEEEQFYFTLQSDIDLGQFEGFCLSGQFSGVIDGGNHEITYTSTGIAQLSENVIIAENETVLYLTTSQSTLKYQHGTAIFEKFTDLANVKNLVLNVTYGDKGTVAIEEHSFMAGLVVVNNGRIENVTLKSFENYFYGDLFETRTLMAYSGIASINSGRGVITACSVLSDMKINDYTLSQMISVSGIVYTNYATVENCTSGVRGKEISVVCQNNIDNIQVAGIAITNTESATLRNCINNFDIQVSSANAGTSITCYMAGVVVLGKGNVSAVNNGTLTATNIEATKGNISAKSN